MKAEDVMKMEAGREVDALVGEHVMGWKRVQLYDREIDMGFFDGTARSLYKPGTLADFLTPGDCDVSAGVGVRQQIGDLRIGGADMPDCSTSLDAAAEVERVAVSRYGEEAYLEALGMVMYCAPDFNYNTPRLLVQLITASALDRCKAALLCSLEGGS